MSYAQLAMDRKMDLGHGPAEPSGPMCGTRPTSGLLELAQRETTVSSTRTSDAASLSRIPFLCSSSYLRLSISQFPSLPGTISLVIETIAVYYEV
jgi:hypothetical protein